MMNVLDEWVMSLMMMTKQNCLCENENRTWWPEYVACGLTLKICCAACWILNRMVSLLKGYRFCRAKVMNWMICSVVGTGREELLTCTVFGSGVRGSTTDILFSAFGFGFPLHLNEYVGCCSSHVLHFGGFWRLVHDFVRWFSEQYPQIGWSLHSFAVWSP